MCPFAADEEVCRRDTFLLRLLQIREVMSISQAMDMERANQEGQEVIQIHLSTKSIAVCLNGQTVYLLVPLLRLEQAPKGSYIGRVSMTEFTPYLPQDGTPVLGLKAMRLVTTEDKAIYTTQDALMLDTIPEQCLELMRAQTISVPRMKNADAASPSDVLVILLLSHLQPKVPQLTCMMTLNLQSPPHISWQMEQKSSENSRMG